MARGSGAGTGVIVALVVSVVCNVGLLTITFMMYTGKAEALENEARAKSELSAFVSNQDRSDAFDRVLDSAKQDGKTLYRMLDDRRGAVATFVTGNSAASLAEMQANLGLS